MPGVWGLDLLFFSPKAREEEKIIVSAYQIIAV